jgi:hypothetical protein
VSDHPWESWVAVAREINEIRDALVDALGGPDSVPPGATPVDMVDALARLYRESTQVTPAPLGAINGT